MRRLAFLIFTISALIVSQNAVYAATEVSNKVFVPLPYVLSTYTGIPHTGLVDNASSQTIIGNQVDLGAIAVDRGIFSWVLYGLFNPNDAPPPTLTVEQKAKYGYEKYSDKRFEPIMKDYTIWAMEAGYLSKNGKANHLLRVNWADIQSMLTALQIKPALIEDYSIYDTDNWGFVTDSEREMIGMFFSAFGRGIDTKSIERQDFTLTLADMIYLSGAVTNIGSVDIDDDEMRKLTGYSFNTTDGRLDNGEILSVCFPCVRSDKDKKVIANLKNWAKKEGFINYEG